MIWKDIVINKVNISISKSIFKFISKLLIMTNFTSFNNYLIKNNINLFDYQKRKLYYQLKLKNNINLFYKCNNKNFIIDRSKINECNVLFLNNNYKPIN